MAQGGRPGRWGRERQCKGDRAGRGDLALHYVLDLWAERWRRREANGDMIIVRYADDFIVGFQYERDARSFLDELRARLQEFALSEGRHPAWPIAIIPATTDILPAPLAVLG